MTPRVLVSNCGLFEAGILIALKILRCFQENLSSEFLASQPAFLFHQLKILQLLKAFHYTYFSGKL